MGDHLKRMVPKVRNFGPAAWQLSVSTGSPPLPRKKKIFEQGVFVLFNRIGW